MEVKKKKISREKKREGEIHRKTDRDRAGYC